MKNGPLLRALSFALISSLMPCIGMAADTAELKVKGSVVPPGCTPSLSAGGAADYGTIPMKSLGYGNWTSLGQKNVAFTITCTAKMTIALAATDNRKSSVMEGAPAGSYGLGSYSGKNIGYYSISIQSITADGASANSLYYGAGGGGEVTRPDGSRFTLPSTPAGWRIGNGQISRGRIAFSTSGSAPAAYQVISGNFIINATINSAANLSATQDIPLDGSATIEVQYL